MKIFIGHVFCYPQIYIFLREVNEPTVDYMINNSLAVFLFLLSFQGVSMLGFIFPNKTKWHNERMELSWLYLIEFDQVSAQCRSNLPTAP